MGFLGGSAVKNPPAVQEIWVQVLGGKDPLEKDMATHSSILAWEISWTEESGGLQSSSVQFSRSVMPDSLQPHESQHAMPPYPSPAPGVYSNSCPSNQ